MKTHKYICKECGSDNVVFDAWAEYDPYANKFVISQVFEQAHCNTCEGECNTKEVEIEVEIEVDIETCPHCSADLPTNTVCLYCPNCGNQLY